MSSTSRGSETKKYQTQRIRELEAEILSLQLCCAEVARAIVGQQAREQLPELRNAYARMLEKSRAAIVEWHRLSDPQAAFH